MTAKMPMSRIEAAGEDPTVGGTMEIRVDRLIRILTEVLVRSVATCSLGMIVRLDLLALINRAAPILR